MPRNKGQRTLEERCAGAPGYLPPEQRPKCIECSASLQMVPECAQADDYPLHVLNHDKVLSVTYGYSHTFQKGNGFFCTKDCGFNFGLKAARRLVEEKRREDAAWQAASQELRSAMSKKKDG